MFGLVTKRQLEQHREDLAREVEAGRKDMEAMKYEWASWYDKFRSLYARLLKRAKTAEAAPGEANGDDVDQDHPPAGIQPLFRSRRGF
jgi:hypothetical protein